MIKLALVAVAVAVAVAACSGVPDSSDTLLLENVETGSVEEVDADTYGGVDHQWTHWVRDDGTVLVDIDRPPVGKAVQPLLLEPLQGKQSGGEVCSQSSSAICKFRWHADKTYRVQPSGITGVWDGDLHTRVHAALGYYSGQTGFTYTETSSSNANVTYRMEQSNSQGHLAVHASGVDCSHNYRTPSGKLYCAITNSLVTVYRGKLHAKASQCGFSSALARQILLFNVINHEHGHVEGLPHTSGVMGGSSCAQMSVIQQLQSWQVDAITDISDGSNSLVQFL